MSFTPSGAPAVWPMQQCNDGIMSASSSASSLLSSFPSWTFSVFFVFLNSLWWYYSSERIPWTILSSKYKYKIQIQNTKYKYKYFYNLPPWVSQLVTKTFRFPLYCKYISGSCVVASLQLRQPPGWCIQISFITKVLFEKQRRSCLGNTNSDFVNSSSLLSSNPFHISNEERLNWFIFLIFIC